MNPSKSSSALAARELTMTRVFRAPRELVFGAWTDPVQLAEWWGPAGFTNPRCEVDVRPGGAIRIDMRAPDGTVYPMGGEFREIVPPQKLVFTSTALDPQDKPIFENLNTVTFEAFEGNQTPVKLHVRVIEEMGEAEQYLKGMEMGWSTSLDRLADYVVAHTGSRPDLVPGKKAANGPEVSGLEIRASRIFNAPRELVWRMWTEAEHITHWWGPNGFTTTIHHMDVRPGGEWRFIMHGPDGTDYDNHNRYEVVVPHDHLEMSHISWPHHRMIVRFADVAGGTEVSVRMVFQSTEDLNKVLGFGADEKLVENLERLQKHMDSL